MYRADLPFVRSTPTSSITKKLGGAVVGQPNFIRVASAFSTCLYNYRIFYISRRYQWLLYLLMVSCIRLSTLSTSSVKQHRTGVPFIHESIYLRPNATLLWEVLGVSRCSYGLLVEAWALRRSRSRARASRTNTLTSEPIIDEVDLVDSPLPAILALDFHHRKTLAARQCLNNATDPSISAEGG